MSLEQNDALNEAIQEYLEEYLDINSIWDLPESQFQKTVIKIFKDRQKIVWGGPEGNEWSEEEKKFV